MKDFSAFDADEAVLVKKPKPIGWFFAGLIAILALGFATAYYLPLHEAHAKLLEKHEELAKKANELDQTLKGKIQSLSLTSKRKDDLERFIRQGQEAETKLKSQLGVSAATVENQLKAYINAKLTHVDLNHEELTVGFVEKAVFAGATERIVPQVQSQICKAVQGIGSGTDLRLTAEVRVKADEKNAWELAGQRASGIGALLVSKCSLASDKVAVLAALSPGDQMKDGLLLHVEPGVSPRLKASEAPAE